MYGEVEITAGPPDRPPVVFTDTEPVTNGEEHELVVVRVHAYSATGRVLCKGVVFPACCSVCKGCSWLHG